MRRVPWIIADFDTGTGRGRDVMRGVSAFARQHGHWHCEFTHYESTEAAVRCAAKADGLLISISSDRVAAMVARLKIPVVVIGRYKSLELPSVAMNSEAIAEMAAKHLIEQGFRRFAYFAHFGRHGSIMFGREFEKVLRSHGYGCQWFQVKEEGNRLLRQTHSPLIAWIRKLPKTTAIFTVGDVVAREVSAACDEAGVRVPGEIAILGVHNDSLVCRMCRPYLSSIDTGIERMGFEAARLLQKMLDGQKVSSKPVTFSPLRVIPRESTEFVAFGDRRVAAAVHYLQAHLHEGVNVKQLVSHLGVSRAMLDQAFINQLGRTAHVEINRMQLQRACRLLEEEDASLTRIAAECGMRYKTRLANFFKEQMRMTPLEYRRAHQRRDF